MVVEAVGGEVFPMSATDSSTTTFALRPRRTVLIVDSDPVFCDLASRALDQRGIDAICAACADEAFRYAALAQPDACVLDMTPRGQCGIEIATALREHGITHAPMIAISSSAVMLRVAHLYGMFSAYLEKPVDPDDLLSQLGWSEATTG